MIYVGIDVAKDKHDCFISNSDGEVLSKLLPSKTILVVSIFFFKELNPLHQI
jgi:transposase